MSVIVVVGGQYGSEGKGKMVSHLASITRKPVGVVRAGGPNAGHTADGDLGRQLLRQLPSGAVIEGCELFLGAGMQISPDLLLSELQRVPSARGRLVVDRNATIVEPSDVELERQSGLGERVSSTLTGTGASIARRIMREPNLRRAADVVELAPYIGDVCRLLNARVDQGLSLIVEGTQGFGLSLFQTEAYPYATGRDTTAAAALSEAGLSPRLVTEIVLVLRTFPIRVAGPSGPMRAETTWEEIRRMSGYRREIAELTTVTRRQRRVGAFEWEPAERAVVANRPTAIALHGADYLDFSDYGVRSFEQLSEITRSFVGELEDRFAVPVDWIFTGPEAGQLVDRRLERAGSEPVTLQPGVFQAADVR